MVDKFNKMATSTVSQELINSSLCYSLITIYYCRGLLVRVINFMILTKLKIKLLSVNLAIFSENHFCKLVFWSVCEIYSLQNKLTVHYLKTSPSGKVKLPITINIQDTKRKSHEQRLITKKCIAMHTVKVKISFILQHLSNETFEPKLLPWSWKLAFF